MLLRQGPPWCILDSFRGLAHFHLPQGFGLGSDKGKEKACLSPAWPRIPLHHTMHSVGWGHRYILSRKWWPGKTGREYALVETQCALGKTREGWIIHMGLPCRYPKVFPVWRPRAVGGGLGGGWSTPLCAS